MSRRRIAFGLLYAAVLTVFVVSCALLAARLADLRRSSAFYAQAAAPVSAVPPAPEEDIPPQAALPAQLAQFAAQYPDAAAWLRIPGTSVDYPVMLGADNAYYLDHLPDGSPNALGSLFLDCRTPLSSPHVVIYGHNGSGGRMFGALKQYESSDYLAAHPAVTLATPDAEWVCPIFSVRRVRTDSDAYTLTFADAAQLADYVSDAAAQSLYPIAHGAVSGVLTLSTCTGWHSQRLIVQAALPAAATSP